MADFCSQETSLAGHFAHFLFSGRTLGISAEQRTPRKHQIGKAEQREELRGVLGQAPVAGLAMAKEVLHHMESFDRNDKHQRRGHRQSAHAGDFACREGRA